MPASFVNNAFNGASSATSATLSMGSLVTGQTIFLSVCALGSGNVPSSVTDNRGNTYTQLYTQNFSASFLGGAGGTITLYAARVATAGSTTATVNFASATTFEINAEWFVGFNTAPFTVETSVSAGGTGTAVSSGATPSNATTGDLVLGIGITTIANGDFSHFFSAAGAGFSNLNDSSGDFVSTCMEWQNAASTTTFTATATLNSSFAWVMACVCIKQTAPSVTFVRGYGTVHSAGATSLNLTSVTLTAGDLGLLCIKWVSATGVLISTVADNLGNIWVAIPGTYQFMSTSGLSSQLYTCLSITTGGTATITVTWAAAVTLMDIGGTEFTSAIRDIVVSSSSNTINQSISITPSQANEMIYAFFVQGSGSPSVGAGFTNAGGAGGFSLQEYMAAGLGNVNYNVPPIATAAASATAVSFGPGGTNKNFSFDAFINPWFASKVFSFDAWIIDPTKKFSFDAFVTNPSSISVVLSYVSLAGNILFKINNPNGFVGFAGTINTPIRSYVNMLGTIKAPAFPALPVSLAGTIKSRTRSFARLIGTINNPSSKSWNFDAVIAAPVRGYVSLLGTIVQKLQQTVPAGAYPDSSYAKLRATIINPRAGNPGLGIPPNDSIQMPGAGYSTTDDWYSSVDAGASYKPGSVFNLAGATLPVGGINLVISAFTTGVTSFQTRTRTWLRRVDAAPSGIVINTQVNTHTLPNGAVITTTTVTTQNQDVLTTTITTQSSATPTRTSVVITEKSVGGQTTTREVDTNTLNGVLTNSEKKTVFSVPPIQDNPQPLKVTTLDGVIHYQFFSANNPEWAGGDQEGVTNTLSQTQIVPGTLNGQSTDSFGNPILSKISSSSITTPDGKVITSTTTETGSSIAKDYGTIVTDTVSQFAGLQKSTLTKTTYPDGSVTTNNKTENALTGESTETDTETVTDEFGQITTTVTAIDTKTFPDPVTGIERQTSTKTVQVTKGGVTVTDNTVITNNDFEDSLVNQKIKVYFIQEFTITCVIDELNLFALSDLNITMQKNYTLLELFGQQLGNANLSWVLRNKLINQFNQANASIVPITLTALGKTYAVVFAQSASAFRAKYIPGTEPHAYELQLILQSRSDIVTGTFGF